MFLVVHIIKDNTGVLSVKILFMYFFNKTVIVLINYIVLIFKLILFYDIIIFNKINIYFYLLIEQI